MKIIPKRYLIQYYDRYSMTGYFAYKRLSHFSDLLDQMMEKEKEKEKVEIPDEVIEIIRGKLIRDRLSIQDLDYHLTKRYLKEESYRKWNQYYDDIPRIRRGVGNGPEPLRLSEGEENELKDMFLQVSQVHNEVAPPDRRCFMSYNFVSYKLAELAGNDDMKNLLVETQIRSPAKLVDMNHRWTEICSILGWPVNGVSFKVRACQVIQRKWRQILAQRRLIRLRIGHKLRFLPGVGIEYQKALLDFRGRV